MAEKIRESEYGGSPNNFHISRDGDTLSVDLTYPPWTDADNVNGQVRYIEIDQEAVRASDGVRLCYDYERDGWSIQQPRILSFAVDDRVCDPDWQETAFVQSWARAETEQEEAERFAAIEK